MARPARSMEAHVLAGAGFGVVVAVGIVMDKETLPILAIASFVYVGIRVAGAWLTAKAPRAVDREEDLAA